MSTAEKLEPQETGGEEVAPSIAAAPATISHQPKWSAIPLFFSCTYSTFLKLRAVNGLLYAAERKYAAWTRWARKAPYNRVHRVYTRDDQGRRTGVASVHRMGEPHLPTVLPIRPAKHGGGLDDYGLRALYQECRHPSESPKRVLTEEEVLKIEEQHSILTQWQLSLTTPAPVVDEEACGTTCCGTNCEDQS